MADDCNYVVICQLFTKLCVCVCVREREILFEQYSSVACCLDVFILSQYHEF